jgi:hypothetical protein
MLLLLGAVARAQAGLPAVRIQVGAGLPFGEAELRRLVDVRLSTPPAEACAEVRVEAGEGGVVVVTCSDRRGEVWIGERAPEDAARTVAVVLADLVTAAPAVPVPARAAPAPEAAVVARVEPVATPPPAPPRLSLWLAPGLSAGGAGAGAAFEPRAGVGWALGPRLRMLLDLGFAHASGTELKSAAAVAIDTVPLRAGVGLALGPLELQAGAVGRGFRAHSGSAQLGARSGGWAAGVWAPRSSSSRAARSFTLFVTVGLDAYLQKLEIRVDDRPALSAGRLAPWAAVGVAWGRG